MGCVFEIPIMTLYEMILDNRLSVFDIPFETRIKDTGLYLMELRRARHDRKKLDIFLKRLKEDMKNLTDAGREDFEEIFSPYFPGGYHEFFPEMESIDVKITEKELSVFDLPFNFRVEYPMFYSTELYTVRNDRKRLNEFLKRAQVDLMLFPEGIQKSDLKSILAPYLPGGKREFYPEFGELCDRKEKTT